MENRYGNLISEFEENIQKLMVAHREASAENALLKAEMTRKQEELMSAHKEILDLRSAYQLLHTADGMSGSAESREKSRRHLAKLVQEIDKCLVLLNE